MYFVNKLENKSYIVMERVKGQTLSELLKQKQSLDVVSTRIIMHKLLQTVSYLH